MPLLKRLLLILLNAVSVTCWLMHFVESVAIQYSLHSPVKEVITNKCDFENCWGVV